MKGNHMPNRRQFIQTAAAVSALPLLRPLASWGAFAPSDRITIGMIGTGYMGADNHLPRLLGRDDVQLVAVSDVVRARSARAADMIEQKYADRKKSGQFQGVKQYSDFRDLLGDSTIDAVLIATPDHWHTIPCILAARAKKHIYCEKPLTHNVAEGRRIVDEVAKAGITFQTGSQQRSEFAGRFRKAVEYVWNGRIGKLQRVRVGVGGMPKVCELPAQDVPEGTDWNMWLGPAPERAFHEELCPRGVHKHFPNWRGYIEYAGGGIADMGAHHFDIAQWGMETDTSGPVEILPPEDPRSGKGLRLLYGNGLEIIHDVFEEGIKADCVFEGTEGKILVSRDGISSLPESILMQPLEENAKRAMPSENHHTNWLEGIRESKATICPAEVGHRSASICHLVNIGYRTGRPLKWDPIKESFVNDAEADKQLTREPRGEWKQI